MIHFFLLVFRARLFQASDKMLGFAITVALASGLLSLQVAALPRPQTKDTILSSKDSLNSNIEANAIHQLSLAGITVDCDGIGINPKFETYVPREFWQQGRSNHQADNHPSDVRMV